MKSILKISAWNYLMAMCFIWITFTAEAIERCIIIFGPDTIALAGVRVRCLNEKLDSIENLMSDKEGRVCIENTKVSHILLEPKQYHAKLLELSQIRTDSVFLNNTTQLDELIVNGDFMTDNHDHLTYRLSGKSMESYPTFFAALNEIPNLTVLSSGALFYQGNPDVMLLLNGVETTSSELMSLSKDEIKKINVYPYGMARFAGRNISSVINVITKSNLSGGNASINIHQAFHPFKGNNNGAFFYNYKRSRISFQIDNDNVHYDKFRKNEGLLYEFAGVTYSKTKTGQDSGYDIDQNSVNLAFQNNLDGSYLYNVKLSAIFNTNREALLQDVNSVIGASTQNFDAIRDMDSRFKRLGITNYFEKTLGKDGHYGNLLANVNVNRTFSNFLSSYQEFGAPDYSEYSPSVDVFSKYKIRLTGVYSEIQYDLPYKKWGKFSASVFESYTHSKYFDLRSEVFQKSIDWGMMAFWYYFRGKFLYMANLGFTRQFTSTSTYGHFSRVVPRPTVSIQYTPVNQVSMEFSYTMGGDAVYISQLSETNQWLDTKLVYHGNSGLKPSTWQKIDARLTLNSKYVDLSFRPYFEWSPNKTCAYYIHEPDYILETIVNLNKYNELYGQLDLTAKPLGNKKWTIWTRLIASKIHGNGDSYKWNGYRYQWMMSSSINLPKWTFELYYQYPGHASDGQLIRPRAECWSVTTQYRPINGLSFGVKWFMPFGNSFRESERTVGSALVNNYNETIVKEWTNLVSIVINWNISFGRNQNNKRPQFSNDLRDYGINRKE